jgi:DHA1 family bicyclomycin/chloramphenicol resistance-like MFS transporter
MQIGNSTKWFRLWIVLLLGSLTAFGPLTLDLYLPALPVMAGEFGTNPSLVQMSLTTCLVGLSVGQLFLGPLSDVKGRRLPLYIGLGLYIASSLACFFASSITAFILLRFVQGVAASAGMVIARAALRDLFSGADFTRFSAKLVLVMGVSPIFAPVLGSVIVEMASWRTVFLVLSLLGVGMLAAVHFGFRETLPAERRAQAGLKNTADTYARLLRDRAFMGYALTQGLVLAAVFAYISGSPFVLQELYGMSPFEFSIVFGLNGFGLIMASQLAGGLAARLGEHKLMMLGLCIGGAAGFALAAAIMVGGGLISILVPLFFAVSSVGMVTTAASSLALQGQGKAAGTASATIGIASFLFGAAASPLVGLGGGHTALPFGLVIAAAMAAAGAVAFFAARKEITSNIKSHDSIGGEAS